MITIGLHNALATYCGAARNRATRVERAKRLRKGASFIAPKAGLRRDQRIVALRLYLVLVYEKR